MANGAEISVWLAVHQNDHDHHHELTEIRIPLWIAFVLFYPVRFKLLYGRHEAVTDSFKWIK